MRPSRRVSKGGARRLLLVVAVVALLALVTLWGVFVRHLHVSDIIGTDGGSTPHEHPPVRRQQRAPVRSTKRSDKADKAVQEEDTPDKDHHDEAPPMKAAVPTAAADAAAVDAETSAAAQSDNESPDAATTKGGNNKKNGDTKKEKPPPPAKTNSGALLGDMITEAAFFAEQDPEASEYDTTFYCNGPPGGKDVFGQSLNHLYYCVIRNACMVSGTFRLMPHPKRVPSQKERIQHYGSLPHCVFRNVGSITVDTGDKGETVKKAIKEGNYVKGLSGLISNSYGQSHITHFMEPVVQLFTALERFGYYQDHAGDGGYLSTPLGPNISDDTPFKKILADRYAMQYEKFLIPHRSLERVMVVGAGGVSGGSWNEHFYHMLFSNRKDLTSGKVERLPRRVDSNTAFNNKCFEEVVMVGASYDPFEKAHAPSYFRQRQWFWGLNDGSTEAKDAAGAKMPGLVAPTAQGERSIAAAVKALGAGTARRTIRILLCHRSSKRKVINADELDRWLADNLGVIDPAFHYEVRSVHFARFGPQEQVALSNWADIMIGIHGADLTNLVYLNPGSVVLELNMLFFFESRFFEMAETLQVHYLAWTCTHPTCTTVWGPVVKQNTDGMWDWTYDSKREMLRINPNHARSMGGDVVDKYRVHMARWAHTDGWFQWPLDAYPGYGCLGCDLLACCTSMQSTLYGTQRETDIIFTKREFVELADTIKKAARLVGTPLKSLRDNLGTWAERLEVAKRESAAAAKAGVEKVAPVEKENV